jgi:hypothetical protein
MLDDPGSFSMTANRDRFSAICVPPDIKPLAVERVSRLQRVDYSAHPFYADLVGRLPILKRLAATGRFLGSTIMLSGKRLINYELIPNEIRKGRNSLRGKLRFAGAGLHNVFVRPRRKRRVASAIAVEMDRSGIAVVVASPAALHALELAAAQSFERLQRAREASAGGKRDFEDSRYHADRREHGTLFDAAQALLEEAGVIAAASEYLGRRARVVDVNPQINDPTDSFWRDIFPDRLDGKKLPKTAYFHRDASGGDLKAILYMVPVTEKNGPFGYVVGSHRLEMSALDNFICEANDHNGLSDTAPHARRAFAALPRRFRQKGAFGNDLLDDSPASRELLRSAWSVTGPKGAIVLFDTKGIHRGGMVEAGERHVITCVIG